jgi:tetratricopeptide (TPR) repeat protein
MGEKKRREVAGSGDPSIQPVSTGIQLKIAKALELVQRGLINEATTILREILSVSPNQFAASYISGDIELWRKNYEQARIHYEHALLSDPHSIPVTINLGAALYGLGRHDEAIKNYNHVLHLQPSNPHAWFNRGLSLLELYEFEAARIAFIRRPGR